MACNSVPLIVRPTELHYPALSPTLPPSANKEKQVFSCCAISAKMVTIPTVPLNSSNKTSMPRVGFGTADYPFGMNQNIKQYILQAIEIGYRHFDTASIYLSEVPLGEAIQEALRLSLIKSRDELFITTKIGANDRHHNLVLPAIKKSLQNLQLEYLDLYLIHFPVSTKPDAQFPFKKEDVVEFDFQFVWEAMEECQNLGLTKSIGVANYTCKKLDRLLATAKIPPAVNQVEMHPFWQQKQVRKFCNEKGIQVIAFSPLGAGGTPFSMGVLDSDVLKEIAIAHGKTVAQVCLRWVYEQGVSVLVKSFNKERMKANLEIFDWKLSEDDRHKIDWLPQKRGMLQENFISDDGPYKSLIDLWDGEL